MRESQITPTPNQSNHDVQKENDNRDGCDSHTTFGIASGTLLRLFFLFNLLHDILRIHSLGYAAVFRRVAHLQRALAEKQPVIARHALTYAAVTA